MNENKDWQQPFNELTKSVQQLADGLSGVLAIEKQLPVEKRSDWGGQQQQQQQSNHEPAPTPEPSELESLALSIEAGTKKIVEAEGKEYKPTAHPYEKPLKGNERTPEDIADIVNKGTEKIKQDRRDEAIARFLNETE